MTKQRSAGQMRVANPARMCCCTGLLVAALTVLGPPAAAAAETPLKLQIVGGLAGVTQFTRLEQPFWQTEIVERSQGRISATIVPVDSASLRGQEMLQLLRLGVVPFGTVLLSVASGEEPEFNALDLPVLNPDMATLRRSVDAFRDYLRQVLRTRYDIELLGIYAYPAQVLFCAKPFSGLDDLAGRRIRTSSVSQSELLKALGALPVMIPFAEAVSALRDGVADCAVTGTLSGYEIGLPAVTTHVHAMAINWGVSFFGANATAWHNVPPDLQAIIRAGVADLERRIWLRAEADTERGLACNAGTASCGGPSAGPMTVVPTSAADTARRSRLLQEVVLPSWIERCGDACTAAWNSYLAPVHAIKVPTP